MAPKWTPKVKPEEAAEQKPAKEPKEGKGGKGKGEKGGKGGGRKQPTLTKEKALASIDSLSPEDDDRKATSKKISWILRKGAERVDIEMSRDGFVKLSDILKSEILDKPNMSEAELMSVIEESNAQKLRYEVKTEGDGTVVVRAFSKDERHKIKAEADLAAKEPKELNADAAPFVPQPSTPTAVAGYPGYMTYPGMGFMPYAYPGWQYMAAMATAAQTAGGPKRYQGRVKSFNAEKGYGFIESVAWGRDVFLHKSVIGEFKVGSFVSFTVETNKEGAPQARDLQASGSAPSGKGKSKGKGKGKDKKEKDKKEDKGEKEATGDKKEGESAEAAPTTSPEETPAEASAA